MTLSGKTALITGGSSGIGLASAQMMAKAGARLAITGQDAAKLEAARATLGANAIAITADVRKSADLKAMREQVEKSFGKLDIFFANAGAAAGTPIATTDEAAYDRLMDINVKGVFFSVQAVLPVMRDGGSIILNTSWLDVAGVPGRSVLSASKAAVRSFTRSLATELLDRRIRVNAVSPGSIATPLHRQTGQTDEEFAAYVAKTGSMIPAGRMGTSDDIASAVLFLASDASSYVLGTEIVVDGGRSIPR